ncbi:MAG TPA: hypothetical protein VGP47_04575 [Parachlamydiaceae bacterium]|nr:hypothetical protein [Parachlamydiaceae bacterium]
MTAVMPVTRQFMSAFDIGMQYMPRVKAGFKDIISDRFHSCEFKKYPSIKASALMIPGSVVLGTCFILSVFVDLIRDTALGALNLLGIGLTFGDSSRSASFKGNLKHHKIQIVNEANALLMGSFYGVKDIQMNLIEGSIHTVKGTVNLIGKLYFAILDRTPIARFYAYPV